MRRFCTVHSEAIPADEHCICVDCRELGYKLPLTEKVVEPPLKRKREDDVVCEPVVQDIKRKKMVVRIKASVMNAISERKERERLEKIKMEKDEEERLEFERLEKLKREKEEEERREFERLENIKRDKEEEDRLEFERLEKIKMEKEEAERREQARRSEEIIEMIKRQVNQFHLFPESGDKCCITANCQRRSPHGSEKCLICQLHSNIL
jgi:hypothetical protein